MTPQQSTDLSLQFTAASSPWWLLLLLPLACVGGWWLYRLELREVPQKVGYALLTLRLVLLCLLIVLAFKPNLISRQVLTFPGRVVLLVDDSASMQTRDNRLPAAEALTIARDLAPDAEPGASASAPAYTMASALFDIASAVRRFERQTRELDRAADAYWEVADAFGTQLAESFEAIETAAQGAALSDELKPALADAMSQIQVMREEANALYAGQQPGRETFTRFADRVEVLGDKLLTLQGRLDAAELADASAGLAQQVEAIRGQSRVQLASTALNNARAALTEALPDQYVEVLYTAGFDRTTLKDMPAAEDGWPIASGETDLIGRLNTLATEDNAFPLTAVVMLSDGRQVKPAAGGRRQATQAVAQALVRKQAPVHAAAVGSLVEPTDLALLDTLAPPFAVAGRPINTRLNIKTALAADTVVQVQIVRQPQANQPEAVVATTEAPLVANLSEQSIEVSFTPEATGLFTYQARLQSIEGEAFPLQNNQSQFAINVREDPVRVLLVDNRPRWETRFVLNTLQRLDYIDLNAIVVMVATAGGSDLPRGARRGAYPDSSATLGLYDLVLIGDLEPGTLSDDEWTALGQHVNEGGRTVALIAPGADTLANAEAAGLLPVLPRPNDLGQPLADADLLAPDRLTHLALTPMGALHPLTRGLREQVQSTGNLADSRMQPTSQVLMTEAGSGQPLISAAFVGNGKSMLVETEQLWKALNPTALAGHAAIYRNLVTWAVESGSQQPPDEAGPRLAINQQSYLTGQPVTLWLQDAAGNSTQVQASVTDEDGKNLAATAQPLLGAGSAYQLAVFDQLPPGQHRFSTGEATSAPVAVMAQDRELAYLAQDARFLADITRSTGGAVRPASQMEHLFSRIAPKDRIEKHETVWRLWDASWMLLLLVCLITVEWVWRKFTGLV